MIAMPIHRMFEFTAKSTPDAIAVSQAGRALTYSALEAAADRIAAALAWRGAAPEVCIGIFLTRRPELIAALLGTLKTGAAYLAMDPAYPPDRLSMMVEDGRPLVLLTERSLLSRIPDGVDAVLTVEDILTAQRPVHKTAEPRPENLAYLLFTSGSTGRPKGVCISHSALANFMASMLASPGLATGERLLAVTSISFDIAALELLLPLLAGGVTIIADRETAADGASLASLVNATRPAAMQATPATWRLLLDSGWRPDRPMKLLCGGEALPPALARELASGPGELWNLYGPTETTIWSTLASIDGFEPEIPIGRPIRNTVIRVMTTDMRAVDPGATGQLCIGGDGLARGYLSRPDLTASRFTPDPLAETPGARLYQTGDRARRRGDGALLCLGRMDRQVKVRGHRIELGEVETALEALPDVDRAVAGVRPDPAGAQALIAWARPAATKRAAAESDPAAWTVALRKALSAKLPSYMLPQRIDLVCAFPLTPNGKIDRRALAEIKTTVRAPSSQESHSPTEAILGALWSEVLGVAEVGPDDSFPRLGGHSLSAHALARRIRETLGLSPAPHELLRDQSLRRMAKSLAAWESLPEPAPMPADAPLQLSFGQQRLWSLCRNDPGNPCYNFACLLLLEGALDPSALRNAIQAIVDRHQVLRQNYVSDDHGTQLMLQAGRIHLPMVDLRLTPRAGRMAEARGLARADQNRPFDLFRDFLLRPTLIRLGPRRWLLATTFHHIAADGWSTAVYCRELAAFYRAETEGAALPPPLPLQYADFAHWQRTALTQARLERQLAYWREALRPQPPTLALPTDRAEPATPDFTAKTVAAKLEAPRWQALQRFCRKAGLTEFSLLTAALLKLLHHYSGQEDLLIGFPIAYRHYAHLDKLIGFFATPAPLRIDLGGAPNLGDMARRVRDASLAVHANADVPIDHILKALGTDRDLNAKPLFQVMLNVRNLPREPLNFGSDLRAELEELPETATKWPLLLHVDPRSDGLDLKLVYQKARFTKKRANELFQQYATLLNQVGTED